ncbi:MAG: serpin family protein [Anaerolineales bacterium]|nr:serpin family protein [Anaerolineales bacterium]
MRTDHLKNKLFRLILLISLLLGAGCSPVKGEPASPQPEEIASGSGRLPAEPLGERGVSQLVEGNTAFALAMYHQLEDDYDNLFFSPYSISQALAMTYAGARGVTREQMAETLRFRLEPEELHSAFNTLDQTLEKMDEVELPEDSGDAFQLNIANTIWGQRDYHFEDPFLDTLANYYGAGLRLLDFIENSEEARGTINSWVSDQTEGKIQDLIPRGGVGSATRLVLTNAIYFNASWMEPFDQELTEEGSFFLLNGEEIQAPMMRHHAAQNFAYGQGENYQVVEIPYVGSQASMLILLPDEGNFEEVGRKLDGDYLTQVLESLSPASVNLTFPKFEFESEISLADTLMEMGMPSAFGEGADFSGMTGTRDLFISEVFHKAFVGVDEEGTEAAAATAVVMAESAMPAEPIRMTVERPFFFLIRDRQTGSILFFGRVLNPLG